MADGGSEDGSTRVYLHDTDGTISLLDDARRSFHKSGFDVLYINGERETR